MGIKDFFKILERPVDEFLEPEKYRTPEKAATFWFKRKAFWKKWAKPIGIAPLLFAFVIFFLAWTHGLFLSDDGRRWIFIFILIVFCVYFLVGCVYISHTAFNPKDIYEIPPYIKDSDED